MTLSQFVSQNKDYGQDVSKGKILPLEYLVSIYNSIKSSEFEVHKKTAGGTETKKESDTNLFNIDLTVRVIFFFYIILFIFKYCQQYR